MRFAYADPPYLGSARKLYSAYHADAADYDRIETHAALIARLCEEYPDGWALSCHEPSLEDMLALTPKPRRVGVWVKPFCSFKPGVNPAYAWEPVIFRGGRKRTRQQPTVRDWIACNVTLRKGLTGAKPEPVCRWILDVLNVQPGDRVDDLFPGTGIMGRVVAERTMMLEAAE